MNNRNRTLLTTALAILVAVAMLAVAAPAVMAQGDVDVSLDPVDGEANQGEVQTYDVNIEDAEEGIGAFEFNVTINDTAIGVFDGYELDADVDEGGDGAFDDSELSDGVVEFAVALGNESYDGPDATVATVDVLAEGDAGDVADVDTEAGPDGDGESVSETNLTDDGSFYDANFDGATFTVSETDFDATVALEPEEGAQSAGERQVFTLGAQDADRGVRSFEVDLTIDDTSIANFSADDVEFVDPGGEGLIGAQATWQDDGDVLRIEGGTQEQEDAYEPAEFVELAHIPVDVDEDAADEAVATLDYEQARIDTAEEHGGDGDAYDPLGERPSTLTVLGDAFFAVDNLDPIDATVQEGEAFDVSADVENTGGEAATQVIEFVTEDEDNVTEVQASDSLELEPGESETVTFEGVTVDEPGLYDHWVQSEDDTSEVGSLNVTELDFELDGLDINIRTGFTIGDDYPLNVDQIVNGDIYGMTGLDLPDEADTSPLQNHDERFLPILDGQHVGLNSLPFLDEEYQWATNETLWGAPADDGLAGFSTADQVAEISWDADHANDDDTVAVQYTEAANHGLTLVDATVTDADGIDANNYTVETTATQIIIEYDGDAVAGSPNLLLDLEWGVADIFAGLDVAAPNQIDFETSHRIQQANERESSDFVTFEVGATGISHLDRIDADELPDEDDEFPSSDLEGAEFSAFQVWQDQLVTFEVENREDQVALYEYQVDDDGELVTEPANRVDPNLINFDQTEPGQVANLNTTNLTAGEYVVTFGEDDERVVGLDVVELNLDAETPEDVEMDEFVELPVMAEAVAEGDNVEAWFFPAGADRLDQVVHVERETLAGAGDITMDDISASADLGGEGEYYALVRHTDSKIMTQTGTFEVIEDPVAVGEVRIEAPDLTDPDEPGLFARGDIIPIELEFLDNARIGTITFGDRDDERNNIEINQTVVDADGSGDALLYLNTYQIGAGYVTNTSSPADEHDLNDPAWTDPVDRNHGFFTLDDGTELDGPAVAQSDIDIFGGAQGGAVPAPIRYELHSIAGPEAWTEEGARDDVNNIEISQRSTDSFTVYTAPGVGDAAFNPTSVDDIEQALEDGELTEIDVDLREVEQGLDDLIIGAIAPLLEDLPIDIPLEELLGDFDLGELDDLLDLLDLTTEERFYNGSIAEDDMLVVQAESDGIEGVLHEAVVQDPLLGASNEQNVVTGDVVTSSFGSATDGTATIDRPDETKDLLRHSAFMTENLTSLAERTQRQLPNVNITEEGRTSVDLAGAEDAVLADRSAIGNIDEIWKPYQLSTGTETANIADVEGDALDARNNATMFDTIFELEPTGGNQPVSVVIPEEEGFNPRLDDGSLGQELTFGLDYVPAEATIINPPLIDGTLEVPRQEAFDITGSTTVAPGTPIRVDMISTIGADTPFINRFRGDGAPVAEVQPGDTQATWNITADFLNARDDVEIEPGTEFETEIRRSGVIELISPDLTGDSQSDPIPGIVLPDPEVVDLEFTDQRTNGNSVIVDALETNRHAFVQIENADGDVIGESETVARGDRAEVFAISLDPALEVNQDLTAVPVIDSPEHGDTYFYDEGGDRIEVTASINVQDFTPAQVRFSNLQPLDASVTQGDTISSISANVENIGDEADEFEIALEILQGGSQVAEVGTQTMEIDGGAMETVTFENVDTDALEPGTYEHRIYEVGEDHDILGNLRVQAASQFEVSDLNPADADVAQGDSYEVSATVTNTGDSSGSGEAELTIDGDVVDTASVSLDGGESDDVSFSADTGDLELGDYDVTVSIDDSEVSGSLSVSEAVDDDEDDADDDGAGFGVAIAALALLGASLIALRRRAE